MKWQFIETAPKDNTDMVLIGIYGILTQTPIYIGNYDTNAKCWRNTYNGKEQQYAPSHWMPLPLPPKR